MQYHFITYATPSHARSGRKLVASALNRGGFDRARLYGPGDLDAAFRQRNGELLAQRRGGGYWIWKAYVILQHLVESMQPQDVLCYCDTMYLFLDNVRPLLDDWLSRSPPGIAIAHNKPNEPTFIEGQWVKTDAVLLMGAAGAFLDSPQAWGGFFACRKAAAAIQFVSAWLTYVQDPRIVTDQANQFGSNRSDFRQHRHDQAVLSLLAKKWGLAFYDFPRGPLQNLRVPFAVPATAVETPRRRPPPGPGGPRSARPGVSLGSRLRRLRSRLSRRRQDSQSDTDQPRQVPATEEKGTGTMNPLFRAVGRALEFVGLRRRPSADADNLPPDLSAEDRHIVRQIAGYTGTSIERQIALIQAVRYLARQGIEGCFVECGVWRGGSSMAVAGTLVQEGQRCRDLYLYDTFEGMTPPTAVDKTPDGTLAQTHLDRDAKKTGVWCTAGLDDVRRNMAATGYPADRVHLIQGPVEATIPQQSPAGPIALLRLDTDWYESTKHELVHLFPLLCEGGVLIIDDYGHWEGARKAVDEYLGALPRKFYVHRIDYTGRLLVKR